jgi:hypothetical protein
LDVILKELNQNFKPCAKTPKSKAAVIFRHISMYSGVKIIGNSIIAQKPTNHSAN